MSGIDSFAQRLEQLLRRIDRAWSALDAARGFPAQAGRIDAQVAAFFAEYIAWELDHPDETREALYADVTMAERLLGGSPAGNGAGDVAGEPERRYREHIDRELSDCMAILDRALWRVEADVDWPDAELAELGPIDWGEVAYRDGCFRIHDRPVFFAGFNMLERSSGDENDYFGWQGEPRHAPFLSSMRRIGVGILGAGLSLPQLVMPDGGVDTDRIARWAERVRAIGRLGFKVDVLFSWRGDPDTLERLWPGITHSSGNSMPLDIDHAGTRAIIERVLAVLLPLARDLPAIIAWDLANEPFFGIDQWSSHTLAKYRARLRNTHETIEALNGRWGTNYSDYSDIVLPGSNDRHGCSPGEWYDRVSFHNERVASFFGFISSRLRTYLPDALIHLKGQDNSSLGPRPEAVTEGIDRERLTPWVDLQGVDTRPLPVTEPRMAAGWLSDAVEPALRYDESSYGFHWLGQSFLYDYLTSLPPHRPVIDLEYHAFSINAIRIPDVPASHAGATLWLAHLHGLVGNMAWYWHRRHGSEPFPQDYFMLWFYGSLSTQPRLAAEYFQSMLRLNIWSREIRALATAPVRWVHLFVSDSSYLQNQVHIEALHRAYEGLCFHGLRLGFVTERMAAEGGIPEECRVLVLPDAEYVSAGAVNALGRAVARGLGVLRFGSRSVAYDEYGSSHSLDSTAFLRDLPVVAYAGAAEVSRQFAALLAPLTSELPLRVTSADGREAFGIMHRGAQIDGAQIVLLVNCSNGPSRVRLTLNAGGPVGGYDLLEREEIDGADIQMAFQGVRLIRVLAGF